MSSDKQPAKNQKILERIRRLLAMAEDSSSPNEAAIAARRAEALMRDHQLTQVDVMVKNLDGDDVEIVHVDHVQTIYGSNYSASGQPTWVGVIAFGVAVMNECEADKSHGITRFFGVAGDAQVAASIFEYLIKETNRLAKQFTGSRKAKNSFRLGCAAELQRRCNAIGLARKEQFEKTSTGKELVVLKQQLIERSTGRAFEYGTTKSSVDALAHRAGSEAGSNINLNPQVESNQQQRRLS